MKGEKEGRNQPGDNEIRRLHLQVDELERFAARKKRLVKKLRHSREFMRAIFNSVNDAVSIIDTANFKIVGANRAFLNLFKRKEKEVVGKYCHEIIYHRSTPCEPPNDVCLLVKTLKIGQHAFTEQVCYDKEGREMHAEVSTSPLRNERGEIYQIIHVIRDITKRWQVEEGHRLHFVSLAETVSHIFSLRTPYAGIHEQGAARLARIVGARLGLDKQELQNLYIGGLLHDIGKVAIPEAILVKPGPLTPEEWTLIRTYPRHGYELLKNADLPWPVAEMALHHQERLDGSGYPDGVRGDKLCREVRIIAACSVVSAMAAPRPYRPACSREEIIEEIKSGQGKKYDGDVAGILLKMSERGEWESGGDL